VLLSGSMRARDTSANAAELQVQIHRQFTREHRLDLAIEMSEFARTLAKAGLQARRPELSEAQLGDELLKQFYGFRSAPK
jgi:hypothetical protein